MRRVEKFSNLSDDRLLTTAVPSVRIRFAFELVNERRRLTQPFESLLGGEPVKLGVAVEILGRALS